MHEYPYRMISCSRMTADVEVTPLGREISK